MASTYKEFNQLNLPAFEKVVLQKWQNEKTFEQSIISKEGAKPFVFYEGPPSANGMPGIHHVISRTLKDLVCRYKTMQGFQVHRKGGWDTHGLPVELGVEKELGITKEDIGIKITVEEYNAKCREVVLRYKDKWDDITQKMGYWVDLNNPYITYENNYIESIWWLLSKMYNRGLLYQSVSIQPYSPAAGTGLSSHELNMPGAYKDVKDTSCVAMFKAIKNEKSAFLFEHIDNNDVFFMAWTTTPWTLPSNLGLTVGPKIEYVLVKTFNPYTHQLVYVILAEKLLHKYFKAENLNADVEAYKKDGKNIPYQIIEKFIGKDIEGITYEQLLPFEANNIESIKGLTPNANLFTIVSGDFVTTDDGTGIVHTAPDFGADDFKMGQKYELGFFTKYNAEKQKIEKIVLVDKEGKFVDGLGEFSGRYVKDYKNETNYIDVNVDIAVKLKQEGKAFKVEKYEHNYPHCWRTDKPILYYPLDAWFIKTTAVKEQMIAANKTINWKPESTGTGRFGNWLENVQDWNLSRSRFWGTPLPIWKTEDGEEQICIGSIAQLKKEASIADEKIGTANEQLFLNEALDLHKPFVDKIILASPTGKPMQRVADLIDVWFDSGAMPFAQHHFPFENKELFAKSYPADFIAEGVDQTRGWFYTLHAIAALVANDINDELTDVKVETGRSYKTVVSNGLVLDKNGVKMSKRLGNVIDPFETIETFGADATRWYLVTNASPWDSLKFDIDGIKEVQRKFFGTLYNTYQFFALYANVDGFNNTQPQVPLQNRPEIDRWILSTLNTLIGTVTNAFENYEPTNAGRAIEEFVDSQLSNWYVRLCRRRFWKSELNEDKISAFQTLYECLITVAKLIAPIAPFFCETIFDNLNNITQKESVKSIHLSDFPVSNSVYIDTLLEERMQLAQDACSLILSLRKNAIVENGERGIKVRQPLQKVMIPCFSAQMKEQLSKVEDLIKAETNVKEIEYLDPNNSYINKKIKANFAALGKKLGAKMKVVSSAISNLNQNDISNIEKNGEILLNVEGETITILLTDVEISTEDVPGWIVATKGLLTTALDITITPDLEEEGNARELINRIQKIRKDANLNLTDRILVQVTDIPALKKSLLGFNSYICGEILADKLELIENFNEGIQIDINDFQLFVNVKVNAN